MTENPITFQVIETRNGIARVRVTDGPDLLKKYHGELFFDDGSFRDGEIGETHVDNIDRHDCELVKKFYGEK